MHRNYAVGRLGSLIVAMALFAGCAPAAAPSSAPTSKPAAPATAAPAAPAPAAKATTAPAAQAPAAAPAQPAAAGKQELTIVQGADPETLDPQAGSTRSALNVSGAVAETMVKIAFTESGPTPAPVLATSWRQVNETTWEFKLRENVKFSNGEPFDAETVKYSIGRIQDPAEKSRSFKYAASVERVEVVNPTTVNLITKAPAPLIPLDMSQVYLVPPKYTAQVGSQEFANKPIGTGPFKLVEWVKDDHATLEANPDYWGGKPKLDRVTFKSIPQAATRSAAVRTGQADVVFPLQTSDVNVLKDVSGIKVETSPSERLAYIKLDQASDPIMKDVKVRQALNYAVDKNAIVEHVFQNYATVLQGQGISAQYFGFNPNVQAYPYDPDKAKQLLAEAGYPNGFSTVLWTSRGRYQLDFETAQAVGGMLQKVGVNVEVKPLEWAVYIKDLTDKKLTPMVYAAWATYPDADPMFDVFLKGTSYTYTDIPQFDALVKQARATMDEKKRLELLRDAAKMQHDEAMAIFLVQPQNIYAVSDRVQGFKVLPNESMELQNVSIR